MYWVGRGTYRIDTFLCLFYWYIIFLKIPFAKCLMLMLVHSVSAAQAVHQAALLCVMRYPLQGGEEP